MTKKEKIRRTHPKWIIHPILETHNTTPRAVIVQHHNVEDILSISVFFNVSTVQNSSIHGFADAPSLESLIEYL